MKSAGGMELGVSVGEGASVIISVRVLVADGIAVDAAVCSIRVSWGGVPHPDTTREAESTTTEIMRYLIAFLILLISMDDLDMIITDSLSVLSRPLYPRDQPPIIGPLS